MYILPGGTVMSNSTLCIFSVHKGLNAHRIDNKDENVKSKALLNRPSEDVPPQLKVEL